MSNVKAYGQVSPGVFAPVAVNADGGLILDPDSVGSGGGSGSGLTDAELRATAVPVGLDAASLAALETINAVVSDGGGTISIDDGGGSLTVDGTVAVSGTVPVSGPLTDTQIRASALPVSGTVAVSGTVPVSGPLTDTQLRATAVPISGTVTITDGSGPVTVDGTVAVSGTVPVSGTFFQATQPVSAASLPLPSGASTAAKQPALGTAGSASADVLSVQGVASMTALKVDGSAVTQPVSGTFWQATQPVSGTVAATIADGSDAATGTTTDASTANTVIGRLKKLISLLPTALGSTTSANSLPVVIASDQGAVPVSGTFYQATQPVSVADTTASGTITANAQTVSVAVGGRATIGFMFSGTFAGITVMAERSTDGGTTWVATPSITITGTGSPTFVAANTNTTAGTTLAIYVETAGATHVRLRTTAYSSGTATVNAAATFAALSPLMALKNSSGFVSVDIGGSLPASGGSGDAQNAASTGMIVNARQNTYNGSTWDRQRGNLDLTILASAARTTTQTSADFVNYNHTDLVVVIDVTAVTSTPSLVVTINGKDALSGKYYTILASAAISTVSTVVLRVGPNFGAAVANLIAVDRLPRTWQVVVTAGNANSATYSVGAAMLL